MLNSSSSLIHIATPPEIEQVMRDTFRKTIPQAKMISLGDIEEMNHSHIEPPGLIILTEKKNESLELQIAEIQKSYDHLHIIVISETPNLQAAVNYLQKGVADYLPFDKAFTEKLNHTLLRLIKPEARKNNTRRIPSPDPEPSRYSRFIVGASKPIGKVFSLLDKAVNTNITVSVYGETGTGKEMIAKAIHENSDRSKHPFVPVNIAAIPDELIESELFGHEKGAFTGAIQQRLGKFEEAQNGTIFLDEIGEMNINMQSKLLRVLQEKEIVRIGGNNTIPLNVRVITATHRNLSHAVNQKTFREDLYYRLLGLPIHLPPLRERGNDILLLSDHFLKLFSEENNLGVIKLSPGAQQKLMNYHYPGNVRELKSIIELAMVMSGNALIKPNDITFNAIMPEEEWTYQEMTLKDYNTKIIRHFLDKYDDNIQEVSRRLDISRSTIYRYLKENEITQV